jgi:cellulose synthase/poly-beta-1,6-N-acetylglucosamine synthase-like glycosyltransferase
VKRANPPRAPRRSRSERSEPARGFRQAAGGGRSPIAGGVIGSVFVLMFTLAFWGVTIGVVVMNTAALDSDVWTWITAAAYLLLVTILTFATVMHLLARWGAAIRFREHSAVPLDVARARVAERRPSLTVLVPSYKEETVVIFRTLLSAALLEYPRLRVVLLIDDSPYPEAGSDDALLLSGARGLPAVVERLLARVRKAVDASWEEFRRGRESALDECLEYVCTELRTWAGFWADDHGNRLLAESVLGRLAAEFDAARAPGVTSREAAESRFRTLRDVFSAEVTSFERKRFTNLPHEPNKAMNLNAYLSLMGGRYDTAGSTLQPAADGALSIDDSDYILTLDADSVLLPDYAMRLVDLMEQPANRRVAVAQTPYSAFPGAPGALERIAGATTDIQYLLHQGMTRFGATFWVGANAVLRKKALEDIATSTVEDGIPVTRYIHDRTVIEDTESSIDLLVHGWVLFNYPERLAFSATPPDLGSLIIQRRRWATGGLVILPRLGDLLRYRRRTRESTSAAGLALQFHYLTSMPGVALAFLLLTLLPMWLLAGVVPLWLVPLVAIPYIVASAGDLRRNGYRATDLIGVFTLNVFLLGVNLAGGLHSLRQIVAGRKSPFVRTPKISERVTVPAIYLIVPLVLAVQCLAAVTLGLIFTGSALVAYAVAIPILVAYGFVRFVGLGPAATDVRAGVAAWMRRSPSRRAARVATDRPPAHSEPARAVSARV